MSVKHTIHCDGPCCGNKREFSLMARPDERLPHGWYEVRKADNDVEPMHFCSLTCLQGFGYEAVQSRSAMTQAAGGQ